MSNQILISGAPKMVAVPLSLVKDPSVGADALAFMTYVNGVRETAREQIMERFNWGKDKYQKVLRQLKELGYIRQWRENLPGKRGFTWVLEVFMSPQTRTIAGKSGHGSSIAGKSGHGLDAIAGKSGHGSPKSTKKGSKDAQSSEPLERDYLSPSYLSSGSGNISLKNPSLSSFESLGPPYPPEVSGKPAKSQPVSDKALTGRDKFVHIWENSSQNPEIDAFLRWANPGSGKKREDLDREMQIAQFIADSGKDVKYFRVLYRSMQRTLKMPSPINALSDMTKFAELDITGECLGQIFEVGSGFMSEMGHAERIYPSQAIAIAPIGVEWLTRQESTLESASEWETTGQW